VLVEVAALAAEQVAEAGRGRVEVEEDRSRGARVAEGVDGVRRRRREHSRGRRHDPPLGAEHELELTLQDVERVGVVMMDVRVGPVLARRVAEPRHDQLVELGQDPERLLRPVGRRLAFTGR
jgi:hypothetical protein